jgi:hypothetical protein
VAHALDLAAIDLGGRAERITGRRYGAEATCSGAQHSLAEELLGAVYATGTAMEFVFKAIHAGNGSKPHTQACANLTYILRWAYVGGACSRRRVGLHEAFC